jgi:hypothetical protein
MKKNYIYALSMLLFVTMTTVPANVWMENGPKPVGPRGNSNVAFELEIMNKSPENIWVTIKDNRTTVVESYGIRGMVGSKRGYLRMAGLDTSYPITIEIYNRSPDQRYSPEPSYVYQIHAQGQTVYLTWDGKTDLRPQTGPLYGLTKKTESGLSLKNNVEASDIQKIW